MKLGGLNKLLTIRETPAGLEKLKVQSALTKHQHWGLMSHFALNPDRTGASLNFTLVPWASWTFSHRQARSLWGVDDDFSRRGWSPGWVGRLSVQLMMIFCIMQVSCFWLGSVFPGLGRTLWVPLNANINATEYDDIWSNRSAFRFVLLAACGVNTMPSYTHPARYRTGFPFQLHSFISEDDFQWPAQSLHLNHIQ